MANRYWVGGSGTWNTTNTINWSATSGGASGASVPTVSDSVFFDQASTYTVTMTGALACLDFNVTNGTVTFQNGTTPTLNVRGGWSTVAATVWNTTGAITFSATTSRTITTNAITIRSPITFNGTGGTWTLQDNVTLLSSLTTTLSAGTLALNNFTLSTGIFTSTTTTTRVITFGTTGQITITGNATTVLSMATLTGFTYTGTARIYSSYSGATGTRTFLLGSSAGAVPTNVFNVSFDTSGTGLVIAPATDTVSLQGVYFNADFTNLTNTVSNDFRFFFGNLTVPASGGTFTAGSNVTNITAGIAVNINVQRTLDFPFSVNSVGGTLNFLNNFTIGSTRTFTLTAGTLALSTYTLTTGLFNSSGSTARTINFGTTGLISLSGNNATILDFTTMTNFTYTGTPKIYSTYTGATGTRTFTFGSTGATGVTATNIFDLSIGTSGNGLVIAAGTDTLSLVGGYNDFDLTGMTHTLVSNTRFIYGDFTIPASGGTLSSGTAPNSFVGSSGTKTITTNGRTLDFPVTINGAGGTFVLNDALTMGSTRLLTLSNGSLQLNNLTLSTGTFASGTGTRNIKFDGGTLTIVGSGVTAFNISNASNFTTTKGNGNGTISMTSSTAKTFAGNSIAYNCTLDNAGSANLTITGNNTFEVLKSSYAQSTGNSNILIPSDGTTTVTVGIGTGVSNTQYFGIFGNTTTGRADLVYTGIGNIVVDYITTRDVGYITNSWAETSNGSIPWRWYIGSNSINNGDMIGALLVNNDGNTAPILYHITDGSNFTIPSDWHSANNTIHIWGGGGGSAGSKTPAGGSGNIIGSSGGGGGGYTRVINFTANSNSTVSFSIGAGGTAGVANTSNGGNGGTTTFSSYSANGGKGSTIIATGTSPGGLGGIGGTFNGGNGGVGGFTTNVANNSAGGGGGGAGGPNGNGGIGGNASVTSGTATSTSGGGGGASSGGTNGSAGSGATGGAGGNPDGGTGGSSGGNGSSGGFNYEIFNSTGSGGGGGGAGAVGVGGSVGGNTIGGGAGGSGANEVGTTRNGVAGGTGGIIIVYYACSSPVFSSTSSMFLTF